MIIPPSINKSSNPRLFDLKQESDRIHNCLNEIRANHHPGEQLKWGSKTLVLLSVKNEMKQLFDEGYTSQQIAQAISQSGFSILPKTITQILNDKPKMKKKSKSQKIQVEIKPNTTLEVASHPALVQKSKPTNAYEDVE